MKYEFDLAVIGSGAGGSVGAHHAASIGKKVVIFESGDIGGECPNWACIPTKALLHASNIYQTIKNARVFGISLNSPKLDYQKIKAWKDLVVSRTGTAHGEQSLNKDNIVLIKAKARFINNHQVEADGRVYSAKNFLLATGSTTTIPPIAGLKETGFITFKEAVDLEKLPKSIFILGGGPIGCEFSQLFSDFGSEVTVADSLDRLLAKDDQEVGDLVKALFEFRGVKVLLKVSVEKIETKGNKKVISYKKNGSPFKTEAEEILLATGKKPNLDFDPTKAGIKIEDGHLKVNQYLQSNVSNIYAAGDIIGPYQFTHTGYYQSFIATHNAFSSKKMKPDYKAIPMCVFTRPEVASVGLKEFQAKDQGIKIKKGLAPISILGKANTSDEFDGFIKIITDKKGVIIGATIVAPHAAEMIHELTLAVKLKVKAQDIANMLHTYPTYSEGIKIACSFLE